jgi:hypothetical protein
MVNTGIQMFDVGNRDGEIGRCWKVGNGKPFDNMICVVNDEFAIFNQRIEHLTQVHGCRLDPTGIEVEDWPAFQWGFVNFDPNSEATNTSLANSG